MSSTRFEKEFLMKQRLATMGTLAGYLGAVILVAAVVGRFYGDRPFIGIKAMNVYLAGVGVIVWGIWARLESRPG
jgi:hypothetical protein